MVCAPLIAIAEIVTGGALSSAIGGALGSQVLGSAVLGLIAAEGNPMGAVLGGLGAAFSGAMGGAGGEAAGFAVDGEVVSSASRLAQETLGNEGLTEAMSMDAGNIANSVSTASELATDGITDSITRDAMSGGGVGAATVGDAPGMAGRVLRDSGLTTTEAASSEVTKRSLLDKVEGFASDNPMLTKVGLGAVQGIGKSMSDSALLKKKKQAQLELEEERRRRAFSGVDYNLPFRPGVIGRNLGGT